MKTIVSRNRMCLRLAVLIVATMVFVFAGAQTKNEKSLFKTESTVVRVDTSRTDTGVFINTTTTHSVSTIDSSYLAPDSVELKKELEACMNQFHQSMEASTNLIETMFPMMDSVSVNQSLDSLITVSNANLEVAIVRMDSCTLVNDTASNRKGLDVLIQLLNMKMNGRTINASYLSSTFLSTVTSSELKQATANLRSIMERQRKLRSIPSITQRSTELFNCNKDLLRDKLVVRTFENAMSQAIFEAKQTCSRKETTVTTQRTETRKL